MEEEKGSKIRRNILLIKAYQKTKSMFFKEMHYTFSIYFTFQGLELNAVFEKIPNICDYTHIQSIYVFLLWNLDLVL